MGFNYKKVDKFWVVTCAIFLFVAVYMIFDKRYERKMFENTSTALGELKKKGKASGKNGPYAIFNYLIDDKYYDIKVWGNFKDSSDTKYYCIEYSIEDPTVARLAKLSECSQ